MRNKRVSERHCGREQDDAHMRQMSPHVATGGGTVWGVPPLTQVMVDANKQPSKRVARRADAGQWQQKVRWAVD
jgi:hypothetical protein